jgi:DNA-binding beta-propeller fold protein YncE
MNRPGRWACVLAMIALCSAPGAARAFPPDQPDRPEKLYVANLEHPGVYVLAPERLRILRTLASAHAACVCVDASRLYLVAPAFVTVVDKTSLRTLGQIPLDARVVPGACTARLAPDGKRLYLGAAGTRPGMLSGIAEIDLEGSRQVRVLAPGQTTSGSIGLSADGRTLYAPRGNEVLVFALPGGEPKPAIGLAPADGVERILAAGNHELFAATVYLVPDASGATGQARAYRLEKAGPGGRITTAGLPSRPLALALSPDDKWLYALCEGWLVRFDLFLSNQLTQPLQADALAVSPDAKRVYLADRGENRLSVWDVRSARVTRTTRIGNDPAVLAVDGPSWTELSDDAKR